MEEQQFLQHLLRLSEEAAATAAAVDARIEAAVGKIEAARAEADKEGVGLYSKIYDNLVADKRDLNARRATLEMQLTGRLRKVPRLATEAAAGAAAAAAGPLPQPLPQQPQPSSSSGQAIPASPSSCPDLVELIVGGLLFTTSRAEESQSQCMLAALVSGRHGPPRCDAQVRGEVTCVSVNVCRTEHQPDNPAVPTSTSNITMRGEGNSGGYAPLHHAVPHQCVLSPPAGPHLH